RALAKLPSEPRCLRSILEQTQQGVQSDPSQAGSEPKQRPEIIPVKGADICFIEEQPSQGGSPCPPCQPEPCEGSKRTEGDSCSVNNNAAPTAMGDVGDLDIEKQPDLVRFTYTTAGREPHEWDNKYVNGLENKGPAMFAGAMYVDGASNFGNLC